MATEGVAGVKTNNPNIHSSQNEEMPNYSDPSTNSNPSTGELSTNSNLITGELPNIFSPLADGSSTNSTHSQLDKESESQGLPSGPTHAISHSDPLSHQTSTESTVTPFPPSLELLPPLAAHYASFVDGECSSETDQFNETIEDLLTKLDEFMGFADLIRGDVNLALGSTLGSIHTKTEAMKKNFERIDQLEAFVLMVKSNLNELEANVNQAEIDLGAINPLKKVFNSITLPTLFGPKPQAARNMPPNQPARPTYKPIKTFRTADYFVQTPSDMKFNDQVSQSASMAAQAISTNTGNFLEMNARPLVKFDESNELAVQQDDREASDISGDTTSTIRTIPVSIIDSVQQSAAQESALQSNNSLASASDHTAGLHVGIVFPDTALAQPLPLHSSNVHPLSIEVTAPCSSNASKPVGDAK